MEFPEDLLYTKEHEWVRVENGKAVIGITEFAQDELGDIIFVELPEIGVNLTQTQSFGVVESVKTVSDLYAPISGTVIDINHNLENEPELVNKDPYDNGWMVTISIKNPREIDNLLSADDYINYIQSQE